MAKIQEQASVYIPSSRLKLAEDELSRSTTPTREGDREYDSSNPAPERAGRRICAIAFLILVGELLFMSKGRPRPTSSPSSRSTSDRARASRRLRPGNPHHHSRVRAPYRPLRDLQVLNFNDQEKNDAFWQREDKIGALSISIQTSDGYQAARRDGHVPHQGSVYDRHAPGPASLRADRRSGPTSFSVRSSASSMRKLLQRCRSGVVGRGGPQETPERSR